MNRQIWVEFIPMTDGSIEGLYLSYGVKLGEAYEVLAYGEKVLIQVGQRLIDVFPSRLKVVEK